MDTLSERLLDLAREHGVPGGQFALRHDGATHTVLFGEEEAGSGQPVREDSKFPTGSITKTFTAALAMVLVDEGDLDLDLPLADQLPDLRVPDASFGEKQTLRQLLSHSSGLPPGRDSDDLAETTRRRYLADCARMRPIPECGSSFSYSNIGYVVTGFLVEHVARMDWREALETILLTPLGVEPAYITLPPPPARPRPRRPGRRRHRPARTPDAPPDRSGRGRARTERRRPARLRPAPHRRRPGGAGAAGRRGAGADAPAGARGRPVRPRRRVGAGALPLPRRGRKLAG
ncbi:serine hydrolase domain-containing protein [Actinomadura keratinilytica]